MKTTFISSYPPRKCGIATYTKDLTQAIQQASPITSLSVVAMDNEEVLKYPSQVQFIVEKNNLDDYQKAAHYINATYSDVVCLQHEYGLFGGENGDYIFNLLNRLNQPIVTTLHTILQNPTEEQRQTLFKISQISNALIAMIPDAKERLAHDYGIPPHKVSVIHHGVPQRPNAFDQHKKRHNIRQQPVMLMTGLLSPNKGTEYVINALPTIKKEFPHIRFIIAGQTHPEIKKHSGEAYRNSLKKQIETLALQENVQFIDHYLNLDELLNLYEACNIYLTPHTDAQQISSGTLAYALGMGKACVSTPYLYAEKMLANGTGLFTNFCDATSIATACLSILRSPTLQKTLETNAYTLGKQMAWPLVAEQYIAVLKSVQKKPEPFSLPTYNPTYAVV